MKKIELKLSEIIILKDEIYGNSQKNIKGLINQELPYSFKYWLHDLGKKVLYEDDIISKIHDELVIKYGTINENGTYTIHPTVIENKKTIINPKFIEFNKEYSLLLEEVKELEYKPFKLKDLNNLQTDEYYYIFDKLISDETN